MTWILYLTLGQAQTLKTFEIQLQSKSQCTRALKSVREKFELIAGSCKEKK